MTSGDFDGNELSGSGRSFCDAELQDKLSRICQTLPTDLQNACLSHLVLLHAVDTWPNGGLYEGDYLKEAIRRYKSIWLPILARLPNHDRGHALPPLDIAFIWHTHRLLTNEYEQYCQQVFRKSFHPRHHQAFGFASDPPNCWLQEQPNESYYPPVPRRDQVRPFDEYALFLQAEVLCQASYGRMFLRSCYQDVNFLAQARLRYARFLLLMKLHPDVKLVPTPDIDLMWRTHISLSGTYQHDCLSILGRVPAHNLGFDPASNTDPSSPLFPAFMQTRNLYESCFRGERYALNTMDYVSRESHPHVVGILSKADSMFGGPRSDRIGAHMLYVHWALLEEVRQGERQQERQRTGLMTVLLSPRAGRQRRDVGSSALDEWRGKMSGLPRFENLPHSSDHKYWRWFRRGPMGGGIVKTHGGVDGSLACVGWASDDLESAVPEHALFPEETCECSVCGQVHLKRTGSGRDRRLSWPVMGVVRVEAKRWGKGYGLVRTMALEGGPGG